MGSAGQVVSDDVAEPHLDGPPRGTEGAPADVETVPSWAANRRGRAGLSVILIVLLACVLAANMPNSALKASIVPWTQPVLAAIGLDQAWGVFSPDPRNDTTEIIARVFFVDGTVEDRTIDADPGFGEYRDYRWRKYEEQLWANRDSSRAWLPYAQWLVLGDTERGHRVREVAIIRRTRLSLPPGPGPDYGPWQDIQLGQVTGNNR